MKTLESFKHEHVFGVKKGFLVKDHKANNQTKTKKYQQQKNLISQA